MVSAKRKSSCTSDDICQKQHKMMKCRGRRNRKRCTCRYDCNNFGESSVCAYSPSDYEMPEVFENSCALSYQECLTGVKFTIQCRGDLCTNDYCYPDHGEVPVNLKQQVCSSENLEKLGFGDPCRRGSVCLNHVWKAGNEKGEGKTAFVNTKQKFEVSKLKNFENSFNDSDLVNYRLHTSCECDRDHSGQFCDNFQKLQAINQNTRPNIHHSCSTCHLTILVIVSGFLSVVLFLFISKSKTKVSLSRLPSLRRNYRSDPDLKSALMQISQMGALGSAAHQERGLPRTVGTMSRAISKVSLALSRPGTTPDRDSLASFNRMCGSNASLCFEAPKSRSRMNSGRLNSANQLASQLSQLVSITSQPVFGSVGFSAIQEAASSRTGTEEIPTFSMKQTGDDGESDVFDSSGEEIGDRIEKESNGRRGSKENLEILRKIGWKLVIFKYILSGYF